MLSETLCNKSAQYSRKLSAPCCRDASQIEWEANGYFAHREYKVSPVHSVKACRGNGVLAPLIVSRDIIWKGTVNFMSRSCYPFEVTSVRIQ